MKKKIRLTLRKTESFWLSCVKNFSGLATNFLLRADPPIIWEMMEHLGKNGIVKHGSQAVWPMYTV